MSYEIVVKKKPYIQGLTREEVLLLLELLEDDAEVLPIEIEDGEKECSVMGFITVDAASFLNFDYKRSGLKTFIMAAIQCKDADFKFNGISICVLN